MASWGGEISPANSGAAITPSDATDFAKPTNGIYVGVGGDVAVVFLGGTAVTFTAVPAGTILPVRAQRVNSTNTTATNMVALWTR